MEEKLMRFLFALGYVFLALVLVWTIDETIQKVADSPSKECVKDDN